MKASPTAQNAVLFNSFVLGIHNYFNRATHVSVEFSRLAYDLRAFHVQSSSNKSGNMNILQTHRQLTKNFTAWVYRTFKIARCLFISSCQCENKEYDELQSKVFHSLQQQAENKYTKSFEPDITSGNLSY